MDKELCLRCGGKMVSKGVEKIQLGQTTFMGGMWSNWLAGALAVEIYVCSGCGKIEFYNHGSARLKDAETCTEDDIIGGEDETPQRSCPQCGGTHDFDYPRCPYCKYRY